MAKVSWKEASLSSLGPPGRVTELWLQVRGGTDASVAPRVPTALRPRLPLEDRRQWLVGTPACLLSCHSFMSQTVRSQPPPLTSKHRHVTSTHHMKYFHGGKQDCRLEVSLLLAGGTVWSSLEAHPALRQQPPGSRPLSAYWGPCLACMPLPSC